jgi:hypothetical protein
MLANAPHVLKCYTLEIYLEFTVLLTSSRAEADGLLHDGPWTAEDCLEDTGDLAVYGRHNGSTTRVPLFRCFNQKFRFASLDPSCGDADTESELGYADVRPSALGSRLSANALKRDDGVRRWELIARRAGRPVSLVYVSVADRIAQTVVKLDLEPLVEPSFHRDSYRLCGLGVCARRCRQCAAAMLAACLGH